MWNMIGRGVYQCTGCGHAINDKRRATELPACKNCMSKLSNKDELKDALENVTMVLPSVTELAINYKKERKKWVDAGKPMRTDERILQIYNEKCEPCDFRRKNRCGFCGCFVKPKGTLLNKIAWGTTRCACWRKPFWLEETDPNNLRNATQEEIDAFNEEEIGLEGEIKKDMNEIEKEMITEDSTSEESIEIIKKQQQEEKNNPDPIKKEDCGCGGK